VGSRPGTARAGLSGGPFEADRGGSQLAEVNRRRSSLLSCSALASSFGVVAGSLSSLKDARRERVQDAETLFRNSNRTVQSVRSKTRSRAAAKRTRNRRRLVVLATADRLPVYFSPLSNYSLSGYSYHLSHFFEPTPFADRAPSRPSAAQYHPHNEAVFHIPKGFQLATCPLLLPPITARGRTNTRGSKAAIHPI
jgi:hypothetical protein